MGDRGHNRRGPKRGGKVGLPAVFRIHARTMRKMHCSMMMMTMSGFVERVRDNSHTDALPISQTGAPSDVEYMVGLGS